MAQLCIASSSAFWQVNLLCAIRNHTPPPPNVCKAENNTEMLAKHNVASTERRCYAYKCYIAEGLLPPQCMQSKNDFERNRKMLQESLLPEWLDMLPCQIRVQQLHGIPSADSLAKSNLQIAPGVRS
ncbi:unnamed protein product [Arabidopsis lyrata]|nr:unnamed protein product [Arabidopsis lyrata]